MESSIEAAPWWPELLAVRDQLSVSELAARFGTTVVAIVLAFKRLGVAKTAQAKGGTPPSAKLSPRAKKILESRVPSSGLAVRAVTAVRVWEVRFRGEDRPRVLVASDFSSALSVAMKRGDVASVALLGPAL